MEMLQQLRNFDKDRADIHDLVALAAFASQLRDEYEKLNVEEPEFLDIQIKSLKRVIKAKVSDAKAARLRAVETQLASLQTPQERRAALLKEKKELVGELAEA